MKSENKRNLFFIGVGPGDPELLTLKSIRLIKACNVLFVPVRKQNSTRSMALNIVNQAMDLKNKRIVFLHFPMVKGSQNMLSELAPAVETIQKELLEGETGVFITLGCSTIYSTAGNLFLALKDKHIPMHFVPGVSSINGAAASSGKPLVFSEEKLAILPTTYSMDRIESFINDFETVVLMKAHSCMDAIMQLIVQKGLLKTSFIVEKATTSEERIHCMADMPAGYRPHYMSTVFIKTKK
jgi:precorrin-2/cobalt-factor-2 C20-methyltransferase